MQTDPIVAIVGKGNVGSHLYKMLQTTPCNVTSVDSRTLEGLTSDADYIILAVSDSAIGDVASKLSASMNGFKGIVAHTAGSVSQEVLARYFSRYGVFYPLQTFSKNVAIQSYRDIPFFVEGNSRKTEKNLAHLALSISDKVWALDSEKRRRVHLASVFACNFTNAMYRLGEEILASENLPFEILRPLITQTADKIMTRLPNECQTGPASRGDDKVMEEHLNMLASQPLEAEIYRLISRYIGNEQNRL